LWLPASVPHLITASSRVCLQGVGCREVWSASARLAQKAWQGPLRLAIGTAYISAALLVQSQDEYGITIRGPTRPSPGWQAQVEGAYTIEHFEVDWAHQRVCCPQGKMTRFLQGSLLSNAVLVYNTLPITRVLERARGQGQEFTPEAIAPISPLAYRHVIVNGMYDFSPPQASDVEETLCV
jgi:hypothetical protein